MVRLYGVITNYVVHGTTVSLDPAPEILEDIAQLPKGTRVGLAWFRGNEWQEISDDLVAKSRVTLEEDLPPYDSSFAEYWMALQQAIQQADAEPIYLEDKEMWLKAHAATIELARENEKRPESDEEWILRQITQNEARRKKAVVLRHIREIERPERLLEAIARENVDLALVYLGDSDPWVAKKESIRDNLGIEWESYATQSPNPHLWPPTVFTRDAQPNPEFLLERQSLERAMRLSNEGRITDQEPDLTGTWHAGVPSEGYFELFIRERKGEEIRGVIEDLLGTATFTGTMSEKRIHFTKVYTKAVSHTAKGEIEYDALKKDNFYLGGFRIKGQSGIFPCYLTNARRQDPLEMIKRVTALRKSGRDS